MQPLKPILTRDHQKGYVKFTIEENFKVNRLVGIVNNGSIIEMEKWLPSGNVLSDDITPNDIIGMWEEPRPRVQLDLPCPMKELNQGEHYYYIDFWIDTDTKKVESIVVCGIFENSILDEYRLNQGRCFATESDAQEWVDAMRNARR